ncbi:MAG: response regulator [Magnetospirillum sp.]|nr:response regulator [Magnetospirillum sp.]
MNGREGRNEGIPPLIVVVEDEAIVLAGYEMLFESWGYRVVAAASVGDALSQLDRVGEPPAFILADYRLKKGETGTEAVATLRRAFGATIPALLVTGDTAVDRLRDVAASGLPILHKPVNGRQLHDILRRSLAPAA